MKKIILIVFAFFCCGISLAQNFNYQAVVRDASNNPVVNQSMTVLIRIIAGGPAGSVLYNEVHTVTSNAQGVISLEVGNGTSGANFQAIDWSTQNHWIDIQVDLSGGSNYTQIGTSKLQFVPYAMYALNSAEAGNAGIFAKNGTVVSNGNGDNVNDDFVFGASQLDYFSANSPLNARMFYDKSKRAFRAGFTFDDEWDEGNIGDYSVGLGEGGLASGRNSFSMGRNANATGLEGVAFGTNAGAFANYSRGFGVNARAFGVNATAIGRQLSANSMAEIQLGQYSKFVSGSADTWVPTDRLFVIGNGQEDINLALNSDALVMLKNGNTTLNGQLTLDGDNEGAGRAFTLPAQDGTANQIMQTDGSGNVSWVTPAASAIPNGGTNGFVLSTDGSGVLSWISNDDLDADPTNEIELPTQTGEDGKFLRTDGTAVSWQEVPNELPTGGTAGQILSTDGSGVYTWVNQTASAAFTTTANVTSNANGTPATDDFVFGSTQIDDLPGIEDSNRIVFDKSNAGAFRAGSSFNTNRFNQDQMGAGSVAFGVNNLASGTYAASTGSLNIVSGYAGYAHGERNTVSSSHGVTTGSDNTITGSYASAHGRNLTSESLLQTTFGTFNTPVAGNASSFVDTDRLFVIGNGTADFEGVNASDALVILKNGNTTLNGTLTIDGDNQASGNPYTLPAQDGTANQVMTTDGSGNVSWTNASGGTTLPAGGNAGQILSTDGSGMYSWVDDATGSGAFSTTANVTSNANGSITTDDFVFGSTQLADDGTTDDDNRLFFDKSKAAFRAGFAENTEWDDANVGIRSVAFGSQNIASGFQSFVMGAQNNVSGPTSTTFGTNNNITGIGTFSTGEFLTAEARSQVTIGYLNTAQAGNALIKVPTDRLFVIGNGFDEMNRSDALVMLKNGNTTLNGQLTIDGDNQGSGTSYTLPAQDGAANQILTTDGSGNVSWTTAAASGAFTTTANVTSNANGDTTTDDFVVGSTQLANDTNTDNDNRRMFFDKSKGAFRAGSSSDATWDDANVGIGSVAFGSNNTVSNFNGFAQGNNNIVSGDTGFAQGSSNNVTGTSASAIGRSLVAETYLQVSLGTYNTEVSGNTNSFVTTDRLLVVGNGTSTLDRSDALVMLKNGNTTLNGNLTIDADNDGVGASYTLPGQDGTANQIMSTDGSGNVSWVDAPTSGTTLPAGGTSGQVLQTDGSGGYSWTDNTVAPGAYTSATLASGWQYYNAAFSVTNFQDPRYRKVNNVVTIEGLCRKNAAINNGETIMTLPAGFRPTKTRIFSVETENGAVRVDVNANGTVIIATGFNVNQNWVSLDGLTFSID
jgi:hypothetical protein